MPQYNIKTTDIEKAYSLGLLPQRNDPHYFYQDTSSRSNLRNFILSSENRRIIKKTIVIIQLNFFKRLRFVLNMPIFKKKNLWKKKGQQ